MTEKMAMVLLNVFWFACVFWAVVLSLSIWYDHTAYRNKGSFCKAIMLIMALLAVGVGALVLIAYYKFEGGM